MSRDNQNNESTSNDKTIYINRVSKVVKGGRRFNFTAMVVTGDAENNKVGVGSVKQVKFQRRLVRQLKKLVQA